MAAKRQISPSSGNHTAIILVLQPVALSLYSLSYSMCHIWSQNGNRNCRGILCPEVERPWHNVDHCPPTSVYVKNAWI